MLYLNRLKRIKRRVSYEGCKNLTYIQRAKIFAKMNKKISEYEKNINIKLMNIQKKLSIKNIHGLTEEQSYKIYLRILQKRKDLKIFSYNNEYGLSKNDLKEYSKHNVLITDLI